MHKGDYQQKISEIFLKLLKVLTPWLKENSESQVE